MTRFILILLLSGCTVGITVNSNPSGADLYVDGNYVGKTPQVIEIYEYADNVNIVCQKDGYVPQYRIINRQRKVTYGIGTANAYSYGNPYSNTTYASGVSNQINIDSHWPSEVFFELKKVD